MRTPQVGRTISFDALPDLDDAEQLIRQRDFEAAVLPLARARFRAVNETQRLWAHARLAWVHNALGQYAQAAGHAAAVFARDDHAAWSSLAPTCDPAGPAASNLQPNLAGAAEALHHLTSARESVRTQALQAQLDLMILHVRPVHERLSREPRGPAFEPGATISGIPLKELEGAASPPQATTPPPGVTDRPAESTSPPPQPDRARTETSSTAVSDIPAEKIDELLNAGRFSEALALCERVAAGPGSRSLSRFLLQHGRALAGTGQSLDATVMFTRCAVLYADSTEAAAALLEAAVIHRDVIGNAGAARRLAERAAAEAHRRGDAALQDRARSVLRSLSP
jgi:hypothetical protein